MKKRLLIALCCLVLLLQILPIVPMAETNAVWEVEQDLYYCRQELSKLPKGEALLFAYDNIVAGIDAASKKIVISNNKYKLTTDEFKLVMDSVRRDHTEQFWIDRGYTYQPDSSGYIIEMSPSYLFEGEALERAKVAFEQAVDYFLSFLTPGMSEYEVEKTLHDKLAQKITYVTSAPNAHNAYGALVEGKAVCEGYAEALQCLLQCAGIQSVQVYGSSRGENHAWNMVRIDGEYYLTDLTWDDQDTALSYAYFNQTSKVFAQDHSAWAIGEEVDSNGYLASLSCTVFKLPTCTATKENYFQKEGTLITARTLADVDISQLGALMKNNNLSLTVFIDVNSNFTAEAFAQWCLQNQNASQIATKAGVSGQFTVKAQYVGREAHIWFETCKHVRMVTVSAKDATCEGFGVVAHRKCNDCGKLFSMESDTNGGLIEIFNADSVTVLPFGHSFTVKTVGDSTLQKKAEKCTEHDTYFLICADCGEMSDSYTFQTEVIGEHAYADTWVADGVINHKRVCANGCGVDLVEAHVKEEGTEGCTVCGYKFSITDLIPEDIGGGEVLDTVVDTILQNPLVLAGGGGGIVLLVIIVIIKKMRG